MTITSSERARPCNKQHTNPCHDCPWRRKAVPGWLGGMSAEEWVFIAHGDGKIDCHTVVGKPQPQCVGAAIFRANVLKSPRDPEALRAEPDKENVFAWGNEFIAYHGPHEVTSKALREVCVAMEEEDEDDE